MLLKSLLLTMNARSEIPRMITRPLGRRMASNRGVTLVELMVSTVLFSIISLSVLMSLGQAYRLAAQVRYRDQARYVLAAASDQFLTASYLTAGTGGAAGVPQTINGLTYPNVLPLLSLSPTPTGIGMAWRTDFKVFCFSPAVPNPIITDGTAAGLTVSLGDVSGNPIAGTLTRKVQQVNPADGTTTAGAPSPAGFLLRADFALTFVLQGRTYVQTTSVVRMAP
jgi:prepilin-type N-terminal cleavage/methylation domain-containing protein